MLALSSVTLAACATASPRLPEDRPAPNPVVTTVVETRLVCPAELDQVLGPPPVPAGGAVVRHNAAGGDFLDRFTDWALYAAGLFNDARAECESQLAPASPTIP